jgi:hypothetical protein
MMIGEVSSTEALSLAGPADDGFAVFAATDVVLAGFVGLCVAVDFGFAVAGLVVNGAGSSSAGGSATASLKPSSEACCGIRQLQPIRAKDSIPMTSILIRFPPDARVISRLLLVDSVTPHQWGEPDVQTRPDGLDVGVRTGHGFRSYTAWTDGLIAVRYIDANEVVFDSSGDERTKCVFKAGAHGPTTVALA